MTEAPTQPTGVLFVCFANMCRSPLAEGIFRHMVTSRSLGERFVIDSAGTSAMEGSAPHPLSVEAGAQHGIDVSGTARQLLRADLARFDHILLMDRYNLEQLRRMTGASAFGPAEGYRAQVRLIREVATPEARGSDLDVADPISGGPEGYATCYEVLTRACGALLDELARPVA